MPVAIVLSAAVTDTPEPFTVTRDRDGIVHVQCPAPGFTIRIGTADAMQLHTALTDALPPREDPRP